MTTDFTDTIPGTASGTPRSMPPGAPPGTSRGRRTGPVGARRTDRRLRGRGVTAARRLR